MTYVDGFVRPVPNGNREKYRAASAKMWPLFKEFGAIRQVECWGDDVPDGKVTDFRRAVQAEEGETIVFAWIEYPSKDVRNEVMRRMMEDPRMANMEMPFDGKRMIFGGFDKVLDNGA